jgi:phosphoglycerate dehydrogenase-like enzyme
LVEVYVTSTKKKLVLVDRAVVGDSDALSNALSSRKLLEMDLMYIGMNRPYDKLLKLDNIVLTPHIAG